MDGAPDRHQITWEISISSMSWVIFGESNCKTDPLALARHEPSSNELMALVGISYAQLKRYISALRTIGCVIRYVRMRDGSQYMTMDDTGVFDRQKLLETGRM